MAPSLLCAEDINACLDDVVEDDDDELQGASLGQPKDHQNQSFFHGDGVFFVGFPLQSEECLGLMIDKECHHLPRKDYLMRLQAGELDLMVRTKAIDWIQKVHAYFKFGPLSAYLSINYLDRFLSNYELPRDTAWIVQLLAVTCLSLAAKLEETEVPISLDLQVGDPRFVFEGRTIQRMELLVLTTLNWRMQAVTPFSFIDYFLHKINDDQPPSRLLISQATELILSTNKGIQFLEFKPSEVATAVAISVLGKSQTVDFNKTLSSFGKLVVKERVLNCFELIQDFSLTTESIKVASASLPSTRLSPNGVLDASCLSYRSHALTFGSSVNISQTGLDPKRRKLNKPSEEDLKCSAVDSSPSIQIK